MDINSILTDFERLQATCRELSEKKVIVGVVSGVDSEVLEIAYGHEYGTDKLPERSFIRASFDSGQEQLGGIVTGAINKALSAQITPEAAANSIGAQAAQLVQNYIDEDKVTPKSNYARKTQHTTLYETGTHIRDRIAYIVEE